MSVFLRDRAAALVPGAPTVRTNLATTPRAVTGSALAAGLTADHGSGTGTLVRNSGNGPDGRAGFARYTRSTVSAGTTYTVRYREPLALPAAVGPSTVYRVSAYLRSSVARTVQVLAQHGFDSFWFDGPTTAVALTANTWTRVSVPLDQDTTPGP